MPKSFYILLIDHSSQLPAFFREAQSKELLPSHWQVQQEQNMRQIFSSVSKERENHCILLNIAIAEEPEKLVESLRRHSQQAPCAIVLIGHAQEQAKILEGLRNGADAFVFWEQLQPEWLQYTIEKAYNELEMQENFRHQLSNALHQNQELEQYRSFVENQLTDRTSELSNIYEQLVLELEQRKSLEEELNNSIRELDTFIYRASHDLRGPIASLMGLTNLAKVEITEPNAQKYLHMIAENSLKLNKILTTLLEVTKFKYVDVDAQAIDFQEMLNKVRYHYMKDFMRENIDFKVKLALSEPFHSDRSLLNSIFQNLIDNSVQYARRDHKSFITVEVQSIEQGVSISVEDNGQGIEKQVQEKVFNMFFKHNSSSKGSGVGLYVVKNCVEKLKGDISFSSEAGQGTRFQIFLPSLKK